MVKMVRNNMARAFLMSTAKIGEMKVTKLQAVVKSNRNLN